MPTLRELGRPKVFRAIGMGDSGTGKTGSLASVINNMEALGLSRVVIADFDQGLDILFSMVKPEFQDKVFFETFRDKIQTDLEGGSVASKSQLEAAWARVVRCMSNWPNVGKINELKPDSLFVCDSITGLGDADMNYVRAFASVPDNWRATGAAMNLQDKFIQMCIALDCHFIMFSHIRFMGGGGKQVIEDSKGSKLVKEADSTLDGTAYPSALGRILPTTVARHFNTMLEYDLVGRNRKIRTQPKDRMALKLPLAGIPDELPQESGLFTIMKAFLGK